MKELIVTGCTIKGLVLPEEDTNVVFARDVRVNASLEFVGSGDFSEYIGDTQKLSKIILDKLIQMKIEL